MSASSQTRLPRGTTSLVRPIAELDVPLARLEAEMELVVRKRLADLDKLREQLPLDDPDRHALDVTADAAFARLVSGPTGGAA